jgi:hypothetical protein
MGTPRRCDVVGFIFVYEMLTFHSTLQPTPLPPVGHGAQHNLQLHVTGGSSCASRTGDAAQPPQGPRGALSLNLRSKLPNSTDSRVQGRTSNALPVLDPAIAQAVSNTLLPAQSLYESAWLLVVQRVQNELNRMSVAHYHVIEAEKMAHKRTQEVSNRVRRDRDREHAEKVAAIAALRSINEVAGKMSKEVERLRADKKMLQEEVEETRREMLRLGLENGLLKEKAGMCESVDKDENRTCSGQDENSDSAEYLLDVIRAQFSEELEKRVSRSASTNYFIFIFYLYHLTF